MDSWPSGVPLTLWNYRAIQAQDLPQIPMMGVTFTREFLVAFAVGFVFLIYVAWTRFKQRETPTQGFRYRVMSDVAVADLGGAAAMRRAYLIYVTTLLFLYVAVAFFGKLIVQTVNGLNLVGIQVDDSALAFDSAQWPLTLAFGFAGLAPLVPQLRAAEDWLFRRAYRAVGIPVRIHQTTRNLLDLIARGKADAVPEMQKAIEARTRKLAEETATKWVAQSVSQTRRDRALAVLAQLDLLVDLARGERGAWPGSQVSDSVRDLEREIVKDAEDLRYEFDTSLKAPPAVELQESFLQDVIDRARDLRDQLVAVMAVYVERDPDYVVATIGGDVERVKHKGLRRVLEEADPPNLAGSGPELGVLTTIVVSFLLYMLFIWKGGHSPLSPRLEKGDLGVILVSAGWEALKLLSLFWFPLLAAFALRQHYCDKGTWVATRSENGSLYAEQRFTSVALAFFVSALCLVGVAALAAFFPAQNVSAFRNNLFGGSAPFILFYPSMAFISVPLVFFALEGADTRAAALGHRGAEAAILMRKARLEGLLCAVLVVLCYGQHLRLWYGGLACTSDGYFLVDLFARGCFAFYGGLDFFTMAALAYLAVAMFGKPHAAPARPAATTGGHAAPPPAAPPATAPRKVPPVPGGAVAAPLILLAILAATATPVFGQDDAKPVVRVGFRADVEPFSYLVEADGGRRDGAQPLYRGFLADLCYWIFDGGDYAVAEVPVTAKDRFDSLSSGRIDVLCDPVTMRFSEADDRAEKGVFSPVVFATGISYLRRRSGGARAGVYVGYVRTSTAASVAAHACRIDLFKVVIAEEERAELAHMCETAGLARAIDDRGDLPFPLPLLKAAKAAAEREKKTVEAWRASAGPRRAGDYAAAIEIWTRAIEAAEACRPYSPDCDLRALRAAFAGDCGEAGAAGQPRGWQATVYRFCPMESHEELIEWFCRSTAGKPPLVYLGDREIILGKLRTWNEHEPIRCDVVSETAAEDLTYEPYALMTGRVSERDSVEQALRRTCITELVQRRIYEFFSFGALARAKFEVYFGADRTMSTPLAYLFLLNGVEEERLFTFPQPRKPERPRGAAPAPVCGAP